MWNAFCFTGVSAWTCVLPRIAVSFFIPTTFFFVLYAALDKSHVDQQSKNNSTCFLDVDYDAFGDQQRASKLSTITVKVRATLHIYIYIYREREREEDCVSIFP